MQIRKTLSVDEIDLSNLDFWTLPLEEREGAFSTLRQENPIPFTEEPDYGGNIPKGRGYWSLTRNADIREASRNPEIFSSAQGATSIADMPPAFLEFFGGMINMDDPRHGRQRRIVSRGFTPRALVADKSVRAYFTESAEAFRNSMRVAKESATNTACEMLV